MSTYYCDLSGTFNDSVGDSGHPYLGPGGLRNAITGDGNATALVAGDSLLVKGTANLTRLVTLTLGTDPVAGGWQITDAVQDNNGGGEWQGKVIALSAGVAQVELATDHDEDDIVTANGINNTTRSDTDTISSKACTGISVTLGGSGDTTSGHIKVIGTNASYANDGTMAVLDGNGDATYCVQTNAKDRWWWENIRFQNATSHNLYRVNGNNYYWVFRHCEITGSGADGMNGAFHRKLMDRCVIHNNTGDGLDYTGDYGRFLFCNMHGNGGYGVKSAGGYGVLIGCLFYDNALGAYQTAYTRTLLFNCTMDNNIGDAIDTTTEDYGLLVYGCRLTHNTAYGIDDNIATKDQSTIEDWNVFCENTIADTEGGIDDGPNSDHSPTDDGYTKRTILITFDGGTNMTQLQVGDTISKTAGWSAKVRTVPTGDATGTFQADTVTSGNPVNNDAFAKSGGPNAVVNGATSIVMTGANATDYSIKSGAEIRSTEIILNWEA